MTTYKAINGIVIKAYPEGFIDVKDSNVGATVWLPSAWVEALRQYFQHERDQELGRWRDPENPDVIVQPNSEGDWVWVLHEATGGHAGCHRTDTARLASSYDLFQSARRYFETHPEPEPKPWEEAKEGEVWALSWQGQKAPEAMIATGDQSFRTHEGYLLKANSSQILMGHRIWPEEKEGETCLKQSTGI